MHVCPECGETTPQPGNCPRDGTPVAAGDDPCLGQAIGSYRIARLLGAGGMGRVYLGVQPTIGSRVAIKVLSRECAQSPELVERFFAEARAVNLIRHEGIVNVLDFTKMPDGRPAIVMEYLDGAPLSAIIEAVGPLPLGGLARIVGEALDALAASHAKAVIHRDLKPDNIFVTQTGHAKVLDFGIAKLTVELARTQAGALLGTPFYMAPEQATASAVDARTDVYSVGVILFEGVTGQKPFAAQTLYSLLRQQVEATPPAPRTLRPDLPPAYEAVILRALQKDPAGRFGSAKEMALALHAATETLPPAAWATVAMPRQAPTVMAGGAKSPLRWTPATPPASLPRPPVTEAVSRTLPQKPRSRTAAIVLALLAAGAGVAITLVATRKPQTQTQTQTPTPTQ